MAPHRALPALVGLLLCICQLALAQTITGVTFTTTTSPGASVPVFSAQSAFTPTATGASPGAGTLVTITESGQGSTGTNPTGLFSFTRPFSSVPPTGNLTQIGFASGGGVGGGGASNLIPDSTNLQRAPAYHTELNRVTFISALSAAALFGMAGAAWVLV